MENSTTYVTPAPGVKFKLSVMMFFQYAIWGSWLPLLWPFLFEHRHLEPGQIGSMFAAGAAGALLAPFIAGQIADRYFPTEKFLGISHILGGLLIWQLANTAGFFFEAIRTLSVNHRASPVGAANLVQKNDPA